MELRLIQALPVQAFCLILGLLVIDAPVIERPVIERPVIEVRAPGKIMLAGEWSVLEPGNYCIVLPVKKYVYAQIKPASFEVARCAPDAQSSVPLIFNSQDIGLTDVHLIWDGSKLEIQSNISDLKKERFNLCFTVMQNSLRFLHEQGILINPFELTVISEISGITMPDSRVAKPGLGSSAAVAVAVCKAILKFHGFDYGSDIESVNNLNIIFKLSCLSHYTAFGKVGSGFDVACSTYQKPIVYRRFDPEWLMTRASTKQASMPRLNKSKLETTLEPKLSDIIFADWPCLEIREIKLPDDMQVLVGFVGYSASTSKMIEKMTKFKQNNLEKYTEIMASINSVVCELISALECGAVASSATCCRTNCSRECDHILTLINKNRDLLVQLGIESGIELETKELKQLIEIAQSYGVAAKLSGAGGGDCGIAVCFDEAVAKKIPAKLCRAGIKLLD